MSSAKWRPFCFGLNVLNGSWTLPTRGAFHHSSPFGIMINQVSIVKRYLNHSQSVYMPWQHCWRSMSKFSLRHSRLNHKYRELHFNSNSSQHVIKWVLRCQYIVQNMLLSWIYWQMREYKYVQIIGINAIQEFLLFTCADLECSTGSLVVLPD